MRKHNEKFMQKRWGREDGDRSNYPQTMAHGVVRNKFAHLWTNNLLIGLLKRLGQRVHTSEVAA